MKPELVIISGLIFLAVAIATATPIPPVQQSSDAFETRCGWFENPTPANIWFWDRDADWTIGVQGGYQVKGNWPWPNFKRGQWVRTNGEHGYGCACLQMRVNKQTLEVLEIKRLVLDRCLLVVGTQH